RRACSLYSRGVRRLGKIASLGHSIELAPVGVGPGLECQRRGVHRRPPRPAVRRAAPCGVHRRGDRGHVPVPLDPWLSRARPWRRAAGRRGELLRMRPRPATGDRCLAFHFTPDHLEAIVAAVPGARRTMFAIPALPPLSSLVPLLAAAEAACDDGDNGEFEELALRLAGAIAAALAGTRRLAHRPSRRDERHVTDALRQIEARSPEQ